MGTGTLTLDSDWAELESPDYVDRLLTLIVDGTGAAELLFEVAIPASGATGVPLVEGAQIFVVPEGKNPYVRVTSGTADVYWSQFNGITCEVEASGYAYNGDGGADHDAVLDADIEVGFDDLTTRSGANPYEMRGYLITNAAGVAAGDSLHAAVLSLRVLQMPAGRTLRIYGLKYNASQASSVTDWSALNGLTKTTAYVDITEPPMDLLQAEVTAILEELQAVSGWTTSSPIQLILIDQGTAATDKDVRFIFSRASQQTNVTILMADGGGPSPPDPGTGGP